MVVCSQRDREKAEEIILRWKVAAACLASYLLCACIFGAAYLIEGSIRGAIIGTKNMMAGAAVLSLLILICICTFYSFRRLFWAIKVTKYPCVEVDAKDKDWQCAHCDTCYQCRGRKRLNQGL